MPTAYFGGQGGTGNFSTTATSGPIGLVGGRLCANGGTYALMTDLYALVGGYSGTVSGTLVLGGGSAGYSAPKDSQPIDAYRGGGTSWLFNGGTYNLLVYPSGRTYYGRAGGGTTSYDVYSFSGTIGGYYNYVLPPTAPQSLSGSPHASSSGSIVLSWSAPSDSGGTGITGYTIVRNGTVIANPGTSTSYTDSGLTPGTSYTYTVRARNAVTAAAGTQSVNSNSVSVVAPGNPSAPGNLTATPSTSVTGRVDLSWDEPTITGVGGITGYIIYRNGSQIAVTSGTGTTYAATGLTPYTSYDFTVRARNAFSDANSTSGPASSIATAVAPGPPSAPSGLTAVADSGIPGNIDLSWTAPANAGAGGITGYNIRFAGGGLIVATTGTSTSYTVTGLNPGQTYSFVVRARNALADTEGTESASSNTATETALGEPNAPTGFTVTASPSVANRLVLSWTAPGGTLTGYSIFERNPSTLVDTLIAVVTDENTSYMIDGLAPGIAKSYFVRARNSYTDTLEAGYPGNFGGAASTVGTAAPTTNTSQTVPNLVAVTDTTNQAFSGTFTINAVTPSVIRYALVVPNVTSVATGGTVTNNTNTVFNGTHTISTPTPSTFTYAVTNANIPAIPVSVGTITDTTNQSFNGTKTVTAVNVGAKTFTYSRTGSAVSVVAVPTNAPPGGRGVVTNPTNTIFNGTFQITVTDDDTFTYAVTHANVAESAAGGSASDITNIDIFNGVYIVTSTPSYNSFTYTLSADSGEEFTRDISEPFGNVQRTTSPAKLDVKYRSGWAG